MKKTPVNPKEYLRGTVSQVFPQWQNVSSISERLTDYSDMEKETHSVNSHKITIYSSRNKMLPLDCVSSIEKNQRDESFFIDVCSNTSPNYLLEFYKNLKSSIDNLPQKFYQQDRATLLIGENNIPLSLPYGFSTIESKEGYVYFVDTTGMVEGEVFSQEISNQKISANETKNYLFNVKKKFYQNGKWYFETPKKNKGEESPKNISCLRFSKRENKLIAKNKKLYCFFHIPKDTQRNKKMFRVIWVFHYNANQIHEQNFQEKIEKDLFDSSVQLQSKKF